MGLAPSVWETELASSLAVTVSQLRFLGSVLASIPLGAVPRLITSPTGKHLYGVLIGIILLYLPFGNGCWHAIIPSASIYLSMKFFPTISAYVGWWITFPYLVAMHVLNASGSGWQEGQMDFTGAEMLLVLKLISMGHSRQDAHSGKILNDYQKEKAITKCPSPLEFAGYLLTGGTLLGGPHFEFNDYMDYVHRQGVWKESIPFSFLNLSRPILQSLVCMAVYTVYQPTYHYKVYGQPEFLEASAPMRFWLCWVLSIVARTKYYFVWSLAEAAMNASGLGYSGLAPGKKNGAQVQLWERGQNVRPWKVELADSFTLVAAHWNISTGNFLRRYVYDRLTPPGKKPGFLILLKTQLVSGVWHGLYPGYWLFFFTTAICVNTSRVIHRQMKHCSPFIHRIVTVPKILFTTMTLAYGSTAFQVLGFWGCFETWKSMYFLPHLICFLILGYGTLLPSTTPKVKST